MIKSLAFNTIILYLLFKTPVSEFALSHLPAYLSNMKNFQELGQSLMQLAWKGGRMTRRMTAVVLFLSAILVLKKIWQHVRGTQILANFIDKYLCCESKTEESTPTVGEGQRKRRKSQRGQFRSWSHLLQQTPAESTSLPLYSSGLISHKLLVRKSKILRLKGLQDEQLMKQHSHIQVFGTIVEEECCPPNGAPTDKIYQSPSFSSTSSE